jgi:hypothetical protein
MPPTTVTYFAVDNGDMTLIALADTAGTKVLIDCNIAMRPTIRRMTHATWQKTCVRG